MEHPVNPPPAETSVRSHRSARSAGLARSAGPARLPAFSQRDDPVRPGARDRPPVPRPLLHSALLTSVIAAAVGLLELLLPGRGPIGEVLAETLLGSIVGPVPTAFVLTLAALLGVATSLTAHAAVLPPATLAWIGIVLGVLGGMAMGGMSTLATAGYLLALAMPLIVALLVVQVIRRYPRARLAVSAVTVLALGAGAVLLGPATRELVGRLAPALIADLAPIGLSLLLVGLGATWLGIAAVALRGSVAAARGTAWVTRHRIPLTVLAACGPAPYALLRLTWLTPWPLLGGEHATDLSVRLQGLLLSSGGWLGIVLTLGLVLPWGELFPRWMPVLAGRPVPVAAAAVPGGAVAALLTFAAVPLLIGAAPQGPATVLVLALVFPCWFWGPALGLAVLGYVGHRRSLSEDCSRTDDASSDGAASDVAGAAGA